MCLRSLWVHFLGKGQRMKSESRTNWDTFVTDLFETCSMMGTESESVSEVGSFLKLLLFQDMMPCARVICMPCARDVWKQSGNVHV